jgi:hypothetical protein
LNYPARAAKQREEERAHEANDEVIELAKDDKERELID